MRRSDLLANAICHSTLMSSDIPPSRASSLPQGKVYTCDRLVGCQAAFASKPAPTGEWCTSATDWSAVRSPSQASQLPQENGVHLRVIGRLSGRHREQAHSHRGRCTSANDWSAVGPSSQASQLPQENGVRLRVIGRLSGRHRRQAHSHKGSAYTFRFSPLNRPSVSSPAALDLDPPAPSGG